MKRALRLAIIPIALAGMILTFSCSDSEHRIPFGYARAVINLNLPPETPDAQAGLIEKIRRLLVPDALAQTAPAAFSSITVRVTGPDIALIEKSFAPYATISLGVPAGALRIFDVTAYVAPGDMSGAASFHGTASANCPAGATVNVPVVMALSETRLLVPDTVGNKIVYLRGLDDPTPLPFGDGAIYGTAMPFAPYDIDYDAMGRIYVTNTWDSHIVKLHAINGSIPGGTAETLFAPWSTGAIAVDRTRSLLHVTSIPDAGHDLVTMDLQGNLLDDQGLPDISFVRGMDVDPVTGHLYIACSHQTAPAVVRYDPVSNAILFPVFIIPAGPLDTTTRPWDVAIRGGNLYVAVYDHHASPPQSSGRVIELPMGLDPAGPPPTLTHRPGEPANTLMGPHRFVAIQPERLTFIDEIEEDGINSNERILSVAGISGSGWISRPNPGIFSFFSSC